MAGAVAPRPSYRQNEGKNGMPHPPATPRGMQAGPERGPLGPRVPCTPFDTNSDARGEASASRS